MEALKLAFDTIIVGALALPWLILIIDLFLRPKGAETETIWSLLLSFLAPFKSQGDNATNATLAVAGVFLFAVAYFLGAAVTRVSGDFFDDDDLGIPVRLPTESNIRTDVYCDPVVRQFAQAGEPTPARSLEADVTTCHCQDAAGKKTLKTWLLPGKPPLVVQRNLYCESELGIVCQNSTPSIDFVDADKVENAKKMIQRTFYRQEAALLQQGDKTDRLNQLHSQVLILRGAAFNGLITLALSLLVINARATNPRTVMVDASIQPERRLIWWVLPAVLSVAGFMLVIKHLTKHQLDDPPFMEVTLLVLGLAGLCMRPRGSQGQNPYLKWLLPAFLLTLFAGFGWWWAEVFYDHLVLYSFYAMMQK